MNSPESNRQPLRIFIASESPLEHRNGVANSILSILPSFRKRGHEVMAMCPKPSEATYEEYPVVKTSKVRLPGFDFNLGIPTSASVEAHMRAFQPDILYAASPYSYIGGYSIGWASRKGIPIVSNYQTRLEMYGNNFAKEIFKDKKLSKMAADGFGNSVKKRTKHLYNKSTLALVPSQTSQDDLLRYGVHTPIRTWRRGVDSALFHPKRKASKVVRRLRKEWQGETKRPIAIYVGRLAPEKRVERLKVLQGLDVQIVVVGKGEAAREKMLRDTLPKGTHFTGQLTSHALADAYAAADMFVHTGTEETFGQTLQEAMASGTPVIAPAAGGPLEIITHGSNGFLYSPEDDQALRVSVATLIDNVSLRAKMGHQARLDVEGRTWAHYAHQLEDYLYEAIAMKSLQKSHKGSSK